MFWDSNRHTNPLSVSFYLSEAIIRRARSSSYPSLGHPQGSVNIIRNDPTVSQTNPSAVKAAVSRVCFIKPVSLPAVEFIYLISIREKFGKFDKGGNFVGPKTKLKAQSNDRNGEWSFARPINVFFLNNPKSRMCFRISKRASEEG